MYPENRVGAGTMLTSAVWIAPSGRVWWEAKYEWTMHCNMAFQHMPFDVHDCSIRMASMRESSDELVLGYTDPSGAQMCGAIGGTDEWYVSRLYDNDIVMEVDGDGSESHVAEFVAVLVRRPSYYLSFVLPPVYLLVAISWSSFLIARAAVPARVAMTIICFLSMMGILNGVLASLPKFSGGSWLLEHIQASLFFVFYSILECIPPHAARTHSQRPHSRAGCCRVAVSLCCRHRLLTLSCPVSIGSRVCWSAAPSTTHLRPSFGSCLCQLSNSRGGTHREGT